MLSALGFYRKAKTINSIHSPFVYELVRRMFDFSKTYYHEFHVEHAREQLKKDNTTIEFEDLGARKGFKKETISDLARVSSSNKWKCKLIQNLCIHMQPEQILEFGTNLGIVTAHLAKTTPTTTIHTIEGIPEIAERADQLFKKLKCRNIELHQCPFDCFLAEKEDIISSSDMIYVDGDHSYEGSRNIFDRITTLRKTKTMILLDDINWSSDMKRFWDEVVDSRCYTTLDIYKMGIVLHGYDELSQEHFRCIPRVLKPWNLGFLG